MWYDMCMILYDRGTVSSRVRTPEGYLAVGARIARTGVQIYDAVRDFGPSSLPSTISREHGVMVRLLRPDDEVFAESTIASCANKPVTSGHPPETVSAANVRRWQVGFSRDNITRDGNCIQAQLLIQDKAAIARVEKDGANQISLGYTTDIDWTSGVDEQYGPYEGIQRDIRCNHIAIVREGRAGPDVRLADQAGWKGHTMATRMIDGITIEVGDQAGQAIDRLTQQLLDSDNRVKSLEKSITDLRGEVDTLRGQLDAERARALDTRAIDALVQSRISLIEDAKKLHPKIEVKGLSDSDIRRAAVIFMHDSFDLKDKSDEYVTAVFDTLLQSRPTESSKIANDLGTLADSPYDPDKARAAMTAARKGGE